MEKGNKKWIDPSRQEEGLRLVRLNTLRSVMSRVFKYRRKCSESTAVNSELLVRRQKKHDFQTCCYVRVYDVETRRKPCFSTSDSSSRCNSFYRSTQMSLLVVWHWSVSLATTSLIVLGLPEHAPQTAVVGRRLKIHDSLQSHAIAVLPIIDSVRSNVVDDDEASGSTWRTEQRSSAVSWLSSRRTCRRTGACRNTPVGRWTSRFPVRSSRVSWVRPANVRDHTCVKWLSASRRSRRSFRAENTSSGRNAMTFCARDKLSSVRTGLSASV